MPRLPTIRAQFPDLAEAAARDQMSCRGFLAEPLMAKCGDRARRRFERRIKAAAFSREKSPHPVQAMEIKRRRTHRKSGKAEPKTVHATSSPAARAGRPATTHRTHAESLAG